MKPLVPCKIAFNFFRVGVIAPDCSQSISGLQNPQCADTLSSEKSTSNSMVEEQPIV